MCSSSSSSFPFPHLFFNGITKKAIPSLEYEQYNWLFYAECYFEVSSFVDYIEKYCVILGLLYISMFVK
jgi:hypothetical protein